MRLLLPLLFVSAVLCDPETLSVGDDVISGPLADTQRSAGPEPFIDRLVSLFSGGKTDKVGKPGPGPARWVDMI